MNMTSKNLFAQGNIVIQNVSKCSKIGIGDTPYVDLLSNTTKTSGPYTFIRKSQKGVK